MGSDIVLYIVVITAFAFDFTNGFHDTANAIATSISTRAMSPRAAVAMSAIFNFAGAFISLEVAATVAKGIVDAGVVTPTVVFGGLIGAIAWNLATWWFGLPSSSSHALIGGMVGSAFVADGSRAIEGDGIVEKVLIPAVIAPTLAFFVAGLSIVVAYRLVGRQKPGVVTRSYRIGQIVTGSMFSLAHGTNDAQKTMGIVTLALIAHGNLSATDFHVPTWVVICSASAISLGTYSGGWRIIRTMGSRIIRMDPAQGFSAQGAGAAVVLTASHLGFPLSTTHVISGGVMGAGAAKRLSAVRWGVAGNIALAWILTLPCSAVVGGVAYGLSQVFGSDALGVVLVTLMIVGLIAAAFGTRVRRGPALTTPPTGVEGVSALGVIDWSAIGELLWVAPLAGLAVAISYSLMIVGFARAGDLRRDGGGGAQAFAYTLLGLAATAAFLAVVAYGVIIIVKK